VQILVSVLPQSFARCPFNSACGKIETTTLKRGLRFLSELPVLIIHLRIYWQERNIEGFYRIDYKCPVFYWSAPGTKQGEENKCAIHLKRKNQKKLKRKNSKKTN